jgi:hypothetical protein
MQSQEDTETGVSTNSGLRKRGCLSTQLNGPGRRLESRSGLSLRRMLSFLGFHSGEAEEHNARDVPASGGFTVSSMGDLAQALRVLVLRVLPSPVEKAPSQ